MTHRHRLTRLEAKLSAEHPQARGGGLVIPIEAFDDPAKLAVAIAEAAGDRPGPFLVTPQPARSAEEWSAIAQASARE
ncbi:hypothetical protein HED60_19240 [Planctomycetales bacterium ZRK34]|nr:hypothetical protein HED60_19240 [Planctomycetales bacterium ZRK34]